MVDILGNFLSMLAQFRGPFNWWFQTITGIFLDLKEWNLQNWPLCHPPLQGHGGRASSAFVHCFVRPGFLCGFSISWVITGNGWNGPQKDKIVNLRLEECFPKCRKHTIDGIRDGVTPYTYRGMTPITFKQWKHFSFFNSHLTLLRTFWG